MAVMTAPVLLPANPNPNNQRYGLFNATNGPLDLPIHARIGGLQYTTPICTLPYGYEVHCITSSDTKTFTDPISTITGNPFVVVASTLCGTVGFSPDEWSQMVVEKLKAGEQAIVEQVFSAGTFGAAPSLANNTPAASNAGASSGVAAAIGTLEGWLYHRYGPTGVIHIPIVDAAYVLIEAYVTKESGVWRTKAGTAVSFGDYANVGPTGAAPAAGHSFWYVTGQMTTWRTPDSDIFVSPWGSAIDKTTNQLRMFAEREYVLAYDCNVAYTDVTVGA